MKTKTYVKGVAALCALAAVACTGVQQSRGDVAVYLDESQPLEKRVEDALSRLTLEEKVGLLHAQSKFSSAGVPRLGIPEVWCTDGPHGIRPEVLWDEWDQAGWTNDSCTAFPALTCLAATWNPEMSALYGKSIGEEARYRDKDVLLGPGVNIYRTPLNGRNFEYMGEDPFLSARMVVPYVQGVQQNGVAACVKHFAVNNQELRRHEVDVVVDDRALHEIYLPAFKAAVQEGGAWAIMGAYNKYKGEHCCHNQYLLNDILKRDWAFDGVVISDWGGVHDTREAIFKGLDMEFGTWTDGLNWGATNAYGNYYLANPYLELLRKGEVGTGELDDKARRVLRLIFRTAMNTRKPFGSLNSPEHLAAARRIAGEGMVLLKNEDDLLPLKPGQRVALIGDFAQTPRYQGAGSSSVNATRVDNLKDAAEADDITLAGFCAGYERSGTPNPAFVEEAAALARKADVVVLCMGLDESSESEGLDRSHICIPENQKQLLEAVEQANENLVVVLSAGSVVETGWVSRCKAVLHAYLSGQAGAGAILDVLTGKVNPSGKLAETWAMSYEDTPAKEHFAGKGRTVQYREGLYVGYRYYDTAGVPTAFLFGYGLSYTSFAYSDLKADEKGVTLTVTNTGSCAGAEVVQLYVAKPDAKVFRPAKELKGFTKVQLEAGESKTVTIPLDDKAFRYWNVKTDRWEVEGGSYQLLVGASSADIRLTAAVTVAGTGAPDPYAGKNLEHYRTAQVQNVPDAEFEALLGHAIPENKVHIDRNMTLGEMGHGRSPIGWLAAAVLGTLLRRSIKKGKPDLNILFQYNMPLRALAKMTNGAISMGMVDGIVMELQGFWIIGLVRVIVEAVKNLVLNSRMEERLKNS